MIPRIGAPPRADIRYTPRPGAYAILPRGGKVLLTLQVDDPDDVQLPGGGIDPGESPLVALHREVREETGWAIAAPRKLGSFRNFTFMPDYGIWAEKICHIYVARPCFAKSDPTEPGHSCFWAPNHVAMQSLANAGNRLWLRKWLRHSGP